MRRTWLMLNFADKLVAAVSRRGTCAVVGIDPVLEKLPSAIRPVDAAPSLADAVGALERYSREVIARVSAQVPAVKINSAFFEAFYAAGVDAYYRLVRFAHEHGLLVIGDIKRGDIGSTAQLYARGHLAAPATRDVDPRCIPDAVTLAGYLGRNAVSPFIEIARAEGKGVFVLVRPSDPGADEVHSFDGVSKGLDPAEAVGTTDKQADGRAKRRAFYEHIASLVRTWGEQPGLLGESGFSCVGAVVAPKDTASTIRLREQMPNTMFLVPGYGAQGADAEACRACFRSDGSGAVVNASRSVIYAFEHPRYRTRFGDDWGAAVEQACRDFVSDLKAVQRPV